MKGHIPKVLDLTKPDKVIKQLADIIQLDHCNDNEDDDKESVYVFNRLATVIEAPDIISAQLNDIIDILIAILLSSRLSTLCHTPAGWNNTSPGDSITSSS
mmetsp:Transcript_27834/g.23024  ORF Transcript_27834/g.23024 Transcript_27834/m.23024 type:complete len:101 (-) Transcript_27834:343-645(-)